MTRGLTALITITGALAGALLLYRYSGWDVAIIDAIAPPLRIADGVCALVTWLMMLDQRRADQHKRRMKEIDAIEELANRYRSTRLDRTGS